MWCGERALILKYEMAICESISVKFFAGPFMNGRPLFFFCIGLCFIFLSDSGGRRLDTFAGQPWVIFFKI